MCSVVQQMIFGIGGYGKIVGQSSLGCAYTTWVEKPKLWKCVDGMKSEKFKLRINQWERSTRPLRTCNVDSQRGYVQMCQWDRTIDRDKQDFRVGWDTPNGVRQPMRAIKINSNSQSVKNYYCCINNNQRKVPPAVAPHLTWLLFNDNVVRFGNLGIFIWSANWLLSAINSVRCTNGCSPLRVRSPLLLRSANCTQLWYIFVMAVGKVATHCSVKINWKAFYFKLYKIELFFRKCYATTKLW